MKNLVITFVFVIYSISFVRAQITPSIVLEMSLPLGSEISLAIGTTNDTTITIDWGDGISVEYTTSWSPSMMYHTLTGSKIKIYGPTIHNFAAADVIIDSADFSNCPELAYLLMQNCGMYVINISENNKLVNCNLTMNNLKTLDVANDTSLAELSCNENQLTNLNISNSKKLYNLSIPYNKISSIDVSNNSLLNYFDCSSNELESVDISKNTILDFFNCGNNNITSLDVSKNTVLSYLHCYNTPLSNIDVSKNLKVAYIDISNTQIPAIDLSANAELFWLYCINNNLLSLDVSKNNKLERLYCHYGTIETLNFGSIPALKELYCYGNKLSSIDVSGVTSLKEFRCNDNLITSIDISNNDSLVWLYCYSNKITSLSLPENSTFMVLDCRYNLLTGIDVSKSIGLKYFRCIDNKLGFLDLSANDSLFQVKCDSNYLTIATLPLKEDRWTTYLYHPQKPILLPKSQYETYESIDLRSQITRAGKSSVYTWKTKSGNTLLNGSDYAESSGVFSFLKGQADSVYCEITNETFPDLILETSRFTVFSGSSVKESGIKTSVWPNPFTGLLRIESSAAIRQIEIYSVAGEKLFETKVDGRRSVDISSSGVPNGMLILKVKYDKSESIVRVVKKH